MPRPPFGHYGIVAVIALWVMGYERHTFETTGQHPFRLR
jgi:hypothetical protein